MLQCFRALVVLALFFFTRRSEQRLTRLAAERDLQDKLLDEMRKLESFRRDFISNVTHEIRTPVTGILGAVEILSDATAKLDEQDRADLQTVLKDQSVRLNALVNDILSLAQLEKAEAEHATTFITCRIADIVHTAVNLIRPQALQTGVAITVRENATGIVRPCDSRLLESAVTNLLQNALRYSGSDVVEISLARTAGHAVLAVTDHGRGIAPEHAPHVFERFYRVDKARSRAHGGSGLGLSIVHDAVIANGGTVTAAPRETVGTRFSVSFPIYEDTEQEDGT